ncbi:MAG: GNAT family N-acetyltransferase [Anaerolineae bacterium]|nr:GNAT family N-acetyltransferase [Anaerolineae bacterium]
MRVVYNTVVEIANTASNLRPAATADSGVITRLLQSACYLHLHADWRMPVDWIGTPGFLVHTSQHGVIDACLGAAADPLPTAWVRLAALSTESQLGGVFGLLLENVVTALREQAVSQLAWLSSAEWVNAQLPHSAFEQVDEIETYAATKLITLNGTARNIRIRPVELADFPKLATLEAIAFDPIWRHSADGLRLGWHQSLRFDVAEIDNRIVAFQYSTRSDSRSAHLVRITVHPDVQGQGVGTALLNYAFTQLQHSGYRFISLNTQIGNLPSQTLYHKFGFRPTGQRYPIWARQL